jgi:protein-L-isoaspartate(D-aspartate) O-methyltransferase
MNLKPILLTILVCLVAVLSGAAGEEETAADQNLAPAGPTSPDIYRAKRETLVSRYITGAGVTDPAVIDSMLAVPRHEFVLPGYRDVAYVDRALPIDSGQTISQPFIVAFMTEALDLKPNHRVLEVGTGSGYQAAVLAGIAAEVYSVEIIDSLADSARSRLQRLGFDNVSVVAGDGYFGLPAEAPFDAVIVTAAAGHVPPPLVEQLKPGGTMIIPVGPVYSVQVLILVRKAADGSVTTEQLLPVRFVPMTGRVQE